MQNRSFRAAAWMLLPLASTPALAQSLNAAPNPQDTASPSPQSEAPSQDGASGLQDIIVTARKREENLQKAAASISVVSNEELKTRGILDPVGLAKVLPNLSLKEGSSTETFVRGVGSKLDLPNVSAAVAFTYNGISIPRYGQMGTVIDVASAQEIAGPQGTLYGGSAAGGAINLITTKPGTDNAGSLVVGGGNYGTVQVAGTQDLAVDGDKFALRGAVAFNRHDAYQSHDLDSLKRIQATLSAIARPTPDLTAFIFGSISHSTGNPAPAATLNSRPLPKDPWKLPATAPTGAPISEKDVYRTLNTDVLGANIDLRVGDGQITYIPGFVHVKLDQSFHLLRYNFIDVHDKESQISQELRYAGTFGRLKASAGVFWLQDKIRFSDNIHLGVLPAAAGYYATVPLNVTRQTNTSYSAFTNLTYSLSDRLRLSAGGRISVDKIRATGLGFAGAIPFDVNEKQTHGDWKVGVEYDVADKILAYATIQTGYIPFGYSPDSGIPTSLLPKSKLLSYTSGLKTRFLYNRVEINSEFFYYDYDDFQSYSFDPATGTSLVLNAKKSRIYGNDTSLRILLGENTRLDGGFVLQSAKHTVFSGPGYNYSGNRMANAPKVTGHASAEQDIALGDAGKLTARASIYYNSGYWGDFTNTFGTFQRAYKKVDLSLTYTPESKRWSAQAFVNNVGNSVVFAILNPNDVPGVRGVGIVEPPRTFGGRVSIHW